MKFSAVTLFPEMFAPVLECGVVGKALRAGLIEFDAANPRDFTTDKHRSVDDTPYGGGPGMLMMPGPLSDAIKSCGTGHRVYLSASGRPLDQSTVERLASLDHLVLVCGRYEGVDQRLIDECIDEEISIGDFVLTGGELGALSVIDAVARYVPGVLGDKASTDEESFASGLLEYPQYTRPQEFAGRGVPEVLSSGNHGAIARYRKKESLERTARTRPELLAQHKFSKEEEALWSECQGNWAQRSYVVLAHHPVLDRQGEVVTTSVTNLDLHDIARSCATYGVAGYTVVTPITAQRTKVDRILEVWTREVYRGSREKAMRSVTTAASIEEALAAIESHHGEKPHVVATSARSMPEAVGYSAFSRARAGSTAPVVFLFGTGWGLADSALALAEETLVPISGRPDFNHLSVRSAVATILDRLFAAPR